LGQNAALVRDAHPGLGPRSRSDIFSKKTEASAEHMAAKARAMVPSTGCWPSLPEAFPISPLKPCTKITPAMSVVKAIHWLRVKRLPSSSTEKMAVKRILVWFSVFWQAGGGLIVALTIKYADSILRCFAQAGAIILIAVVSSIFLDFVITIEFSVGVTLVIISVFLYGGKAETPLQSFQGFKTCLCAEWYGSMSVQEDEEGDVDLELEGDVDLELEGDVNLDASLHERQIDKDAAGDDVFHLQDAGPKPAGSNTTATEAAGRVVPSVKPQPSDT